MHGTDHVMMFQCTLCAFGPSATRQSILILHPHAARSCKMMHAARSCQRLDSCLMPLARGISMSGPSKAFVYAHDTA